MKDYKQRWMVASVLLNIFFAITKLAAGYLTATAVIIADGIHSLSDIITSSVILLSVKFAGMKNERFPEGLHKLEDLAALFSGIFIIYAGYEILIHALKYHHPIRYRAFAVLFLIFILIIQFVFTFLESKAAKKYNSPALKADAAEWLFDASVTVVAIFGVVFDWLGVVYAQKIAVFVIVIFIFKSAYELIKDAVLVLLDASVEKSVVSKAKEIIESFDEVEGIDMLFIRKAGSVLIGDIILKIRQKNMVKAHEIVEKIENSLKKNIENLHFLTIHYEPAINFNKKRAILLDMNGNIAKRIRDAYKVRFETVDEKGDLVSVFERENPFFNTQRGYFVRFLSWLVKQNVNEIVFNYSNIDSDRIALLEGLDIKVSKSN